MAALAPAARAADSAPDLADAQASSEAATHAIALLERTAAALAEDAAATLAAINAGQAPYRDPQDPTRYVFVYDMQLTIVAHYRHDLVGRNMKGVADADGKFYRDDILAGAKKAGKGWEDYHYSKPDAEGIHPKRAYYQRVTGSDGKAYIVCSAIYLD
ncbi:hypothetical protein JCM17961_22030 [Endothiovibrio diazotrophicus]